jgi:hypothetical protein
MIVLSQVLILCHSSGFLIMEGVLKIYMIILTAERKVPVPDMTTCHEGKTGMIQICSQLINQDKKVKLV